MNKNKMWKTNSLEQLIENREQKEIIEKLPILTMNAIGYYRNQHQIEEAFIELVNQISRDLKYANISEICNKYEETMQRHTPLTRAYFSYLQKALMYIDLNNPTKEYEVRNIFTNWFKEKELTFDDIELLVKILFEISKEELIKDQDSELAKKYYAFIRKINDSSDEDDS